jgi:hypothetical protein
MARGAAAISVVALLVVAVPVASSDNTNPDPPSSSEDVAAIAESLDATPPNPPPAGEVEASETAHADLSDSDALALAQEQFPELVRAELIPEIQLRTGQSLGDFVDRYAVQVENSGNAPDAVVESTLPVRAPEGGSQQPLDGDLEREGDHFEADNPVVDTEIAADPTDGFEITAANVTVVPAVDQESETRVVEDKVAIPNSATDTDTLIAPTATGAELAYFLRSAESPQELPLAVDLPADGVLRAGPEGSAIVERDGQLVVGIGAPSAVDAAGQPVPIHYELSGAGIDIVVPHRDAGYVYPIAVDPVMDYYGWAGGDRSTNMWNYLKSPSTSAYQFFGPTVGAEYNGLKVKAPAYSAPPVNSFGEWYVNTFPNTFIEEVDYLNVDHINNPYSDPQTCTIEGIWSNGYWATGSYYNQQTGGTINNVGWVDICGGPLSNQTRKFWVGNNPVPDVYGGGDPEGANQSQGIFMLMTTSPGWQNGYRTGDSVNLLRSTTVWRYDWNAPTISGSPPTAWVDDSGANRASFYMADQGLGVRNLEVKNGSGTVVSNSPISCAGDHLAPCPLNYTMATQPLPEGLSPMTARAIDAGGTASAPISWTAKIDRSAPTITSVTGSLKDERTNLLSTMDYSLNVAATDGSSTRDDLKRSGVTSVELWSDGAPIVGIDEETGDDVPVAATQPCDPTNGSCAMNAALTVPAQSLSPGTHTIQPVATDALGHRTPLNGSSFQVTVRDDPDDPTVSVSATAANGAGDFTVHVDAHDGNPYNGGGPFGSGISHIEVFLDGTLSKTIDQPCPDGGCPRTEDIPLNAAGGTNDHEVVVITYDRAGNSQSTQLGKQRSAFDYYGFNGFLPGQGSDPVRAHLDRAVQGASNVVRFSLSWCALLENVTPANRSNPATWNWDNGGIGAIMTTIRQINTEHAGTLHVLPNLVSAPPWASGASSSNTTCKGDDGKDWPVKPPDPAHYPDWRFFVGAVAQHYSADPNYGLLGLEVWNEPNLPRFWGAPGVKPSEWQGSQPEVFGTLFNEAYQGLVAANMTSVKLVPGGLSPQGKNPGPREYARRAFTTITPASSVQALSIHLYASLTPNGRKAVNKVGDEYQAILDGIGDSPGHNTFLGTGVPRWITEIGFPSAAIDRRQAALNSSVETQRKRLLDSWWRFAFKDRIHMFMVHTLYDPPLGTVTSGSDANNFGLWRANPDGTNTAKAIYCRLGKLAQLEANPYTASVQC